VEGSFILVFRPLIRRRRCVDRVQRLNVFHPRNQAGLVIVSDDAELQLSLPQADSALRLLQQRGFFLFSLLNLTVFLRVLIRDPFATVPAVIGVDGAIVVTPTA
jgi:hypothetical protein